MIATMLVAACLGQIRQDSLNARQLGGGWHVTGRITNTGTAPIKPKISVLIRHGKDVTESMPTICEPRIVRPGRAATFSCVIFPKIDDDSIAAVYIVGDAEIQAENPRPFSLRDKTRDEVEPRDEVDARAEQATPMPSVHLKATSNLTGRMASIVFNEKDGEYHMILFADRHPTDNAHVAIGVGRGSLRVTRPTWKTGEILGSPTSCWTVTLDKAALAALAADEPPKLGKPVRYTAIGFGRDRVFLSEDQRGELHNFARRAAGQ